MADGPTFTKTRIAPTPSGYLHLGNALSFVTTVALAKKYGAKILLRIDDLDRERVQDVYVQDIFDTLHFLGIMWDEGPKDLAEYKQHHSQLHRIDMYNQGLLQLADSGAVFVCTCSRAQVLAQNEDGIYMGTCKNKHLPFDTPDASWRLDTTAVKQLTVKTLADTVITTLPEDMQYFVVRKKDGFPAYQLTSLLDDVHYGIDLIVRGEDLWHSTLAQHYLAMVLGKNDFLNATFHHHPLVKIAGEKLSKSAGATSIQYLRKEGRTSEEVMGMIVGL
jgi:glutamyl-tRNA synthetase